MNIRDLIRTSIKHRPNLHIGQSDILVWLCLVCFGVICLYGLWRHMKRQYSDAVQAQNHLKEELHFYDQYVHTVSDFLHDSLHRYAKMSQLAKDKNWEDLQTQLDEISQEVNRISFDNMAFQSVWEKYEHRLHQLQIEIQTLFCVSLMELSYPQQVQLFEELFQRAMNESTDCHPSQRILSVKIFRIRSFKCIEWIFSAGQSNRFELALPHSCTMDTVYDQRLHIRTIDIWIPTAD